MITTRTEFNEFVSLNHNVVYTCVRTVV